MTELSCENLEVVQNIAFSGLLAALDSMSINLERENLVEAGDDAYRASFYMDLLERSARTADLLGCRKRFK